MTSNTLLLNLPDVNLITLIQSNSELAHKAKELLLIRYNHLILKVLKPYLKFTNYEDLYQFAVYGFIISLDKFNLRKGKSLGIYAKFHILNAIYKFTQQLLKYEKSELSFQENKTFDESALLEITGTTSQDLDTEVDYSFKKSAIERFRLSLSDQENEFIELVFFQGKTFTDAAKEMNICKQRASQIFGKIKKLGIQKLKHYIN